MSSFESPLKAKKVKEAKKPQTREETKKIIDKIFKKPKSVISISCAKKIVKSPMVGPFEADWIAQYIKNWVESESMPPQLYSSAFVPNLYRFLGPTKAEAFLARLRLAYQATFLHTESHTDIPVSNTLIENDDSEEASLPDIEEDPIV